MMQLFTEEGWSIVTNKKRVGLLVLVGGDLRQYIYEQMGADQNKRPCNGRTTREQ